jgi:hypothetical protein
MSKMTAVERLELGKLVRLNAKVAKDDIEARGKSILADAEAKLAAIYGAEDEAWADVTAVLDKQAEEADAVIAAICRQRGIPEKFRPSVDWFFTGRGEKSLRERRAELRKAAQTQVAARVAKAKVEIDRQAALQLTQIARAGLTSEEARAFISSMPSPAELLPPLETLELRGGELVRLEAPATPETDSVTLRETTKCYECAFCGEAFTPKRRDSKYCRDACRVAEYRKRHASSEDIEA